MENTRMLRAIGALLGRAAQSQAADAPANEVIDLAPLLRKWKEGEHAAGEVCVDGDYPYRCIQAHDSTGNALWRPSAAPALWAPYHATDAAHALPWAAPTHAGDAYQTGEWMIYTDDVRYRCTQDATVYGPDVLPQAWEAEAQPDADTATGEEERL